ncbi:hypothetical protein ACIBK8_34950 [Streptomyces sp. NPDC050161]|uniref:hypothetical protein n=1 Tax=Streptomyces sp. NPDC050161 TaxID=3365604 RepID=UPI0037B79D6C
MGKRVRAVLHASHLVVYDKNVEVVRRERLIAQGHRPPGAGPLPGGPGPQARRLPWLHRPRTGPLSRQVHLGP